MFDMKLIMYLSIEGIEEKLGGEGGGARSGAGKFSTTIQSHPMISLFKSIGLLFYYHISFICSHF